MAPPPLAHVVPSSHPIRPSSARLLTPTTNAIPILSAASAKNYSIFHTILTAVFFYLRAPSLVRDPLSTLIQDLLPVAVSQAAFCAVCLPSAGNWNGGTKEGGKTGDASTAVMGPSAKTGKGSVRRKGAKGGGASEDGGDSWTGRIRPTIFSVILTFTLPPGPLFVVALCLGAPLFPYSQLPHTLLLAVHVSLLGFLPIFYTHGVSGAAWKEVSAAWLPFDEAGVWGATVGTLVGGWVGAIPIALDWDREWQKWPCTVVWGVVMGWCVGRVLTGVLRLGIGVRINMSEKQQIPLDLTEEQEKLKDK